MKTEKRIDRKINSSNDISSLRKASDRVVLIGPMGVGKTTIGSLLAKSLNYGFVDTDRRLEEQTGASISLIFDVEGEAGFRKREKSIIRDLLLLEKTVIATGGGSILLRENRQALMDNSVVIYLRGQVDTLLRRTRFDKSRPLLNTPDPRETIADILEKRGHLYEAIADLQVDVDDLPSQTIVSTILAFLA